MIEERAVLAGGCFWGVLLSTASFRVASEALMLAGAASAVWRCFSRNGAFIPWLHH